MRTTPWWVHAVTRRSRQAVFQVPVAARQAGQVWVPWAGVPAAGGDLPVGVPARRVEAGEVEFLLPMKSWMLTTTDASLCPAALARLRVDE